MSKEVEFGKELEESHEKLRRDSAADEAVIYNRLGDCFRLDEEDQVNLASVGVLIMQYRGVSLFELRGPTTAFEGDDKYKCPIFHSLIIDPVVLTSGQMFDRTAINGWFSQLDSSYKPLTCPFNRTKVSRDLINVPRIRDDHRQYLIDSKVRRGNELTTAIVRGDIDFFFRERFLNQDVTVDMFNAAVAAGDVEMIRFMMITWNFKIIKDHLKVIQPRYRQSFVRMKFISAEWLVADFHKAVEADDIPAALSFIESGVDPTAKAGDRHIYAITRSVEMLKLLMSRCGDRIKPTDPSGTLNTPVCLITVRVVWDYFYSYMSLNSLQSMDELIRDKCKNVNIADAAYSVAFLCGNTRLMQMVKDACVLTGTLDTLAGAMCNSYDAGYPRQTYANILVQFVSSELRLYNHKAFELLKRLVGVDRFTAMIISEDLIQKCPVTNPLYRANWIKVVDYFMKQGAVFEKNHCSHDVHLQTSRAVIDHLRDKLRREKLKRGLVDPDADDSDSDPEPPTKKLKAKDAFVIRKSRKSLAPASASSSSAAAAAAASDAIDISDDSD